MIYLNILIFVVLLIFSPNAEFLRLTEGGKRRVRVPNDLDDIIDNEEDEAWKQWGEKSVPPFIDPDPSELENMDELQIQELTMKQQAGPVYGFIKLRLGVHRTEEMVAEIAIRWTEILLTGTVDIQFTVVDQSTTIIMFTLQNGRQSAELKEFILNQPEAYEIRIGNTVFRRPGDPPLKKRPGDPSTEELLEKLRSQKNKNRNTAASKVDKHVKQEL